MQINTTRKFSDLEPVLYQKSPEPEQVAYWVFSHIETTNDKTKTITSLGNDEWENMTIIVGRRSVGELPKTFGHYHTTSTYREIYKVVHGQGIFILQEKFIENGNWVLDKVGRVFLVKATETDVINVPKNYGHSWSNDGSTPLVTIDNWKGGHVDSDYKNIEKQRGMSYYFVRESDTLKIIKNPSYKYAPDPIWITAIEFNNLNL